MLSNSLARWMSARSSRRHSSARDDQRHEIDAPRLGGAGRIGEQIMGDARLAHPRVELLHAHDPGGRVERGELCQQRLPVRLDRAGGVDQLVEAPAAAR